jgi:1-acyl-sn-glycerol-3-phosphate acyltransferase
MSRHEKLAGVLEALRRGDVVGIFPEGHTRRPGEPPLRPFRVGVVLLHRATGAPIVPMAVRVEPKRWRRKFMLWAGEPVMIPEGLDDEASAEWLRERIGELYERTKGLR